MAKANTTNRTFSLFTLLFILLAACSFVAFRETKEVCSATKKCSQVLPSTSNGEMIWDGFSRRFISLISLQ